MRPATSHIALEDLLYLPGDILQKTDDPSRSYLLESTTGYHLTLLRLNEDGSVNERLKPMESGLAGWKLVKRPQGVRFVRVGNMWSVMPSLSPEEMDREIEKAVETLSDIRGNGPKLPF